MAYGELVIDGTLVSSGVLDGQVYVPIATASVEAEKIPEGESMTILDDNFQVVARIPEGDYWVRVSPDAIPVHVPAAEFETQYRLDA